MNNLSIPKEKEAQIRSSVISQLKTEISSLKDYIKKMNLQIRKNFNLEIQLSLEEGFAHISQKIKNREIDQNKKEKKDNANEQQDLEQDQDDANYNEVAVPKVKDLPKFDLSKFDELPASPEAKELLSIMKK